MFKQFRHLSIRASSAFVIRASSFRLSHKRNSKGFDRLNRRAAISLHDETPKTEDPWVSTSAGTKRERIGANDDQWRGRDLSVPDLLEVVR